jgi:hypothetical protein
VLLALFVWGAVSLPAQQKGQYLPGQFGLNAGVMPEPDLHTPISTSTTLLAL